LIQRTILASQLEGEDAIFVFGLLALEYDQTYQKCSTNRNTVFIQYVDTTGLYSPREDQRHVTNAIIEGFLLSPHLRQYRVHCYASANPHYLFKNSENHGEKNALGDEKLVPWWARRFANQASTGHYFVFREEKTSFFSRGIAEILGKQWEWGHPYDPKSKALETLPVYPDDQKAVKLKTIKDDLTVDQFFEELDAVFRKRAAIFAFQMKEQKSKEAEPQDRGDQEKGDKGDQEKEAMEKIVDISELLMKEDFGSKEAAKKSTTTILAKLKTLDFLEHSIHWVKKERTEEKIESGHTGGESAQNPKRPLVVNNLDGLVKRKKK